MKKKDKKNPLERYVTKENAIYFSIIIFIILIMAIIEFSMGRLLICDCGYVSFWYNYANGPGNSQHLFDWYTFTHLIHGMFFYFILWFFFRKMPLEKRLILAVLLAGLFEVFENSPMMIERYRQTELALGYVGDSILNSVSDIFAMFVGFIIAKKSKIWITILIVLVIEISLGIIIRDGLILNVINLIYPTEFIGQWQSGATRLIGIFT